MALYRSLKNVQKFTNMRAKTVPVISKILLWNMHIATMQNIQTSNLTTILVFYDDVGNGYAKWSRKAHISMKSVGTHWVTS